MATVAELAFVAQWALLMHEAGARRAALLVFGLIVAAEALSWLAVLARNDLFHAAENATLDACGGASRWDSLRRDRFRRPSCWRRRRAPRRMSVFMVVYVVPMYVERWRAGNDSLALAAGLRSVLAPCMIERDWALWRRDALWLTPYFTVCVWFSLALAFVPPL